MHARKAKFLENFIFSLYGLRMGCTSGAPPTQRPFFHEYAKRAVRALTHSPVADEDGREGEHKLRDVCERAVNRPRHAVPALRADALEATQTIRQRISKKQT